jgi:hypothetical protein
MHRHERDCRRKAEQERDDAIAARQEAEERLLEVQAAQDVLKASQVRRRLTHGPGDQDTDTEASGIRKACITVPQTIRTTRKTTPATEHPVGSDKVEQPRRRGRPAKPDQAEVEIVEWWKPGWHDRSL